MKYILSAALILATSLCFGQANTWSSLQDFGGTGRDLAASFPIGSKVYIGTGLVQSTLTPLKDVWEYDISGNSWTKKNDFDGAARVGAVGFTINGKGYIALGGDFAGNFYNDIWEYDPATDDWTKKTDFPGGARVGSFVFVVNNKAYIGAGQGATLGYNDLWEYDPSGNTWTQKSSLPAVKRVYAVAFAIGTKGYVGTGQMTDSEPALNDLWEYDVAGNQWNQKADYPVATAGAVAFATTSRGFIAIGGDASLYSYYPSNNSWVQEADFPDGLFLANGVGVFTNGKAYIGTGFSTNGETVSFYSYTPGTEQTITFNALPAKTFGDPTFALTATSSSSLTVSYSSSDIDVATISGSTVTINNAGTTVITATQIGNSTFDIAVPVQQTLTVNKASQTITFNAVAAKNVTDAPFALTASSTSGLAIAFTSSNTTVATVTGNTVAIVAAGTTTLTANQSGNNNYNAATAVQHDLVVSKLSQSITFGALASQLTNASPFALTATASSGLDVVYTSSNTNVATISDNTVTIVGPGTTTITASQPGNATYSAATSVDQSLTVTKASQSWVGSLPTTGGFGNEITLSLHLSSNLPYTLTASDPTAVTLTLDAGSWTITPKKIGTVTLTASSAGNATFDAVSDLVADLVISKGTQTITFPDIPTMTYGTSYRYLIIATASSGLPLTFETNATLGEISISGNVVSIGSAFNGTITAKQAGNDFYSPAQVTKSIVVQKSLLLLTMEPIPEKAVGDPPFRPFVTPDVGYLTSEFHMSSTNTSVATIVDGMVNVVGKGTTDIIVSHNADTRFFAAAASQTLIVKDKVTITFEGVPTEKTYGDAPFQVNATADPSLPITFSSSDNNVATVSGNTVAIVGRGDVLIAATAGDATHATTTVTRSIHVNGPAIGPSIQGQLLGVQTYGGSYKSGSIYKTNSDGTGVLIAKEFKAQSEKGSHPVGTPVVATNGKIYGFTSEGGANGNGMLYEYDPIAKTIVKKYDVLPYETITQKWMATSNGKIYGVKSNAIADASGPFIVSFDVATGEFSNEVNLGRTSLNATDALIDYASDFVIASNGKMYVTGRLGTMREFIEYDPVSKSVKKKAEMPSLDFIGKTGMVEGANGRFYGTFQKGGNADQGFVFEFDPVAGTATQKASFVAAVGNPTWPHGLVRASTGKLYGHTTFGGDNKEGYVFEYDPVADAIISLASFPFFYGNSSPNMVEGPDGIFYGSGYAALDSEFFFDFNPANNILRIVCLPNKMTGQSISGDLVLLDGKFLSFAFEGGSNGVGSVVEFDYINKTATKVFDFGSGSDEGYHPTGGLTVATNGLIYGITREGGTYNDGTIFSYNLTTDETKTVWSFTSPFTGAHPQARLIMGNNGKLYGGTWDGGPGNSGTIFEYDPQNGLRTLVNLGPNGLGVSQRGEVAVGPSGKIYALTDVGGTNLSGALLEINPGTREAKQLYSLPSQAHYPENGIMMASNGKLYATTSTGGANSVGTLIEYDIDAATFAIKHDFDVPNGSNPNGSLTEFNGKLYGLATSGGSRSTGVIYEYDPATSTYSKKHEFLVGAGPLGKLLLAQNGKMYGTLSGGNAANTSVIFEYDATTNAVVKTAELPGAVTVYYPNVSLEQPMMASRRDQTVTIDPIADKTLGGQAFTPTATATSGAAVTLSAVNAKITVANNVVTMVAAGKATIKAKQDGNASYNASPEVQATFCINPAKPSITYSGANTSVMTLTSSNSDGNQWYKDGTPITNATGKTLSVSTIGIYTVKSTVEDCASELSLPFPVIITGDIAANENAIALYPNPVQDRLYIILPGANQKRVTLISMSGRIAAEHQTSAALLEIDVRDYSTGMYVVRITDETGERPAMKFIKK